MFTGICNDKGMTFEGAVQFRKEGILLIRNIIKGRHNLAQKQNASKYISGFRMMSDLNEILDAFMKS